MAFGMTAIGLLLLCMGLGGMAGTCKDTRNLGDTIRDGLLPFWTLLTMIGIIVLVAARIIPV
ncbi:hypothetical protein BAAM0483_05190 [Bifidobacterium animalis subsp. animalis MCC 0483]|uniref:Uncharacterized protein n=1 Tax=Bifidobacterium animalis subsp. animalis MCC 0483 TaxID=1365955 RepID=A0AB34T8L1_9BIFI|nr:hypothetical protein [Bifidobacterium animalis]KOA49542.1 hypothetical protein BAAM0483_05190 [Bifidobacterium animalis subsp. animalis MCC 0483]KOA60977.1 hypothetical protein BAAM0499_03660 [Bifidobacterium animalis subsp. animalis MCC 0499]MCR1995066.1 hypothetical protein [Bifidobacterium animalis subsp. animalis]RYN12800.1 hypothetical protein PG2022B_0898 [Bifidobacterium animalis subsp. animalis]